MSAAEYTNQIESDAFLAGLESTDDSSMEIMDEDTTVALEGESEQTNEGEQKQDDAQETENIDAEGDEDAKDKDIEMFPRPIIFLGEEKQISMDEAVPLIQKGLNYDRVIDKYKGQLADVQNDRRIVFVENLAQKAGVDANTYITMQENQGEYQSLIDTYGDISAVPPGIMEKFNKYSQSAIEKTKADSAAAKEQAFLDAKAEEYMAFVENHPEFGGEMPQEVMAMVAQGESLEGAYARYLVSGMKKELAQVKKDFEIYKTNTTNKNSQMPTVTSGKKKEQDAFLDGFLG